MKTLKLKWTLPFLAFMFAIVAAFATQSNEKNDNTLEQGYIFKKGVCQESIVCSPTGSDQCTSNGMFVYGKINETVCDRPLYFQ